MIFYSTLFVRYQEIAEAHLIELKESRSKFKSKYGTEVSINMLQLTPEHQYEVLYLSRHIHNEAITTILFTALSLEAYLNYIGVNILGEPNFTKFYERLSNKEKLIIFTKIKTGRDFPVSDNIYREFNKMFEFRNKLAHAKSKGVDMSKPDYYNNENPYDDVDKDISFALETEGYLNKFYTYMTNLLGTDYFEEQHNYLFTEIDRNVLEIYSNAFRGDEAEEVE